MRDYRVHVRKHRAPKGALRPVIEDTLADHVHAVRKHRAPKGALRLETLNRTNNPLNNRQKAPSAIRCIKTHRSGRPGRGERECRQKAPSAKRCIKTATTFPPHTRRSSPVRKHRTPKGALRHDKQPSDQGGSCHVRKHRAPKGALRRAANGAALVDGDGQKAPSAKRCIKTVSRSRRRTCQCQVRKHRAPKGALRQRGVGFRHHFDRRPSESTERQKAH